MRRTQKKIIRSEAGFTMLETLVSLALLGIIAVALLGGVTATSRAATVADERTTAESLSRTQMEWVKKATYVPEATTYTAASIPIGSDYDDYSVNITAAALNSPDDGVQKITVSISHYANEVARLEGYKVNR